ncbi:PPA1309 family protein [Corynebacterium sp.]|uniref:PPA1309 family protein n=1 Tax=Corynebacterium sp. TaxID=1720 RepID=UPI0026DD6835|nr:PPA1309 family protein [Corynebacterium sp.]MDO5032072.1 PPA1309 family protein [Corynebacterium sp.]
MSSPENSQRALNKAMREAVEFVHAEGWDAAPTLFALVPTELLAAQLGDVDDSSPLTLVVQDNLPENIEPGSEQLADYVSRLAWPREVAGVVLAQEIVFADTSADSPERRPARLFSGVLREEGVELTLLQHRPTEEELEAAGLFAQDDIQLRGGPQVAPGVIAALRYGLEQDPDAEF